MLINPKAHLQHLQYPEVLQTFEVSSSDHCQIVTLKISGSKKMRNSVFSNDECINFFYSDFIHGVIFGQFTDTIIVSRVNMQVLDKHGIVRLDCLSAGVNFILYLLQ
jgi:hypothetical protein